MIVPSFLLLSLPANNFSKHFIRKCQNNSWLSVSTVLNPVLRNSTLTLVMLLLNRAMLTEVNICSPFYSECNLIHIQRHLVCRCLVLMAQLEGCQWLFMLNQVFFSRQSWGALRHLIGLECICKGFAGHELL